MNHKHLPVILLATLFICSCSKNNDNTPTPTTNDRIKTYTEDLFDGTSNTTKTFNLIYDADGRLTTAQDVNDPTTKIAYSFPQNGMYKMDIIASGVVSIHEDFYLNAASQIDSTMQFDEGLDTTTEKYVYNQNRQLLKIYEYSYSATVADLDNTINYEYNSDGTISKMADDYTVTTYEYYADLSSNVINIFQPYIALSPKVVKSSATSYFGDTPIVFNYTYEFDDKKRLARETARMAGSDIVVTKTYSYQ